jgi:uncharacterized membrane protein
MNTSILQSSERNVGTVERWASVVVGSALTVWGLRARDAAGIALAALGGAIAWRGASGRCPVYGALGVSTAGEADDDNVSVAYGRGVRVEHSVRIDASPERLYAFWRNFENLPRFMHNLESVTVRDRNRSHWVAKGPLGSKVEWEAEIINEVPNELIGWRSVEGSQIDNAGSVHFTPDGRGTIVRVLLRYDPPAGVVGATVSKLLGEDPSLNVEEDLRRMKSLVETGGLPNISRTTEGLEAR